MGLLQRALETYEANMDRVGVYYDGESEPLAPVAHRAGESGIVITLSQKGQFLSAEKSKASILFPVTEDSINRTSIGAIKNPHPLCDKLSYLGTEYYISGLERWANSAFTHDTVKCVLAYMRRGTLMDDLAQYGIGKAKADPETIVRWHINGFPVGMEGACWKDRTLFDAYTKYYMAESVLNKHNFCMVSGEHDSCITEKHPGLIFGNTKFISTNENGAITFSGRFTNAEQACTVSFIASQKAHNALRWLISNQGSIYGKKTKDEGDNRCAFLCWNPQGEEILNPVDSLLGFASDTIIKPSDYKDKLNSTLLSFKEDRQLDGTETAVTASFEAATKGRVAITYYSEFTVKNLLDRMKAWDEYCCWVGIRNYRGFQIPKLLHGVVQTPNLLDIIDYAYGTLQGKQFETAAKTIRQQIQRLVVCKMNQGGIPPESKNLLMQRANHMELYGDDEKWDYLRSRILFVACAAVRKYRHDYRKEEWGMSLEPERKDIGYQYGRLLAVLEKMERDAYDDDEKREPNAVRMQLTYMKRPQRTAQIIWERIRIAYMRHLTPKARNFYHKLIGQIMEQISRFSEEKQKQSLDDTYMLGYYLQRNELYTKKNKEEMTDG